MVIGIAASLQEFAFETTGLLAPAIEEGLACLYDLDMGGWAPLIVLVRILKRFYVLSSVLVFEPLGNSLIPVFVLV